MKLLKEVIYISSWFSTENKQYFSEAILDICLDTNTGKLVDISVDW